MREGSRKYRNRTLEGMSDMSYTIGKIELREFYTHIHANLNSMSLSYTLFFVITLTFVTAFFGNQVRSRHASGIMHAQHVNFLKLPLSQVQ